MAQLRSFIAKVYVHTIIFIYSFTALVNSYVAIATKLNEIQVSQRVLMAMHGLPRSSVQRGVQSVHIRILLIRM